MIDISPSNSNLSIYTQLISCYLAGDVSPRAFSLIFEKLYLRTDFLLPEATVDLIGKLYELARDWDDPNDAFRTLELALVTEAERIICQLDELEAAANRLTG
jgi:hypothetical protein